MANNYIALGLTSLALLSSCGGSGDASNSTSLTITGTAATGAAISAGTAEFVCANGTGSGISAVNGSFTVTITGGALPCVGKVIDGVNTYHTLVAVGTTDSAGVTRATANITPMTELVMASVAGSDTGTFYSNFGTLSASDKSSSVTSAKLSVAQSDVKQTLTEAGINTLGGTDLLTSAITPGSPSDAYDVALDTLKTKLTASGSTLSQLSTTVGTSSAESTSSDTGVSTASNPDTAALPASFLLKPQATTCAALRTATYRLVGSNSAQKLEVDAAALTATYSSNGTTDYLLAVAGDACHFKLYQNSARTITNNAELMLSAAGVGVVRTFSGGSNFGLAVLFAEQSGLNTLANAAGQWNTVSMEFVSGSTYGGALIQSAWDSLGNATNLLHCSSANTAGSTWDLLSLCQSYSGTAAADAAGTLSVNTGDNGYFVSFPGDLTPSGKRFVYRSGTGNLMAVSTRSDGSISVSTRQRSMSAPVVGTSADSWNLSQSQTLLAGSVTTTTATVVSVADATSSTTSYVRTNQTTGLSDLHSESLTINQSFNGFRLRPAGTDSGVNYVRLNQLPVKGSGITAALNETGKRMLILVNKPI